MSARRTLEHPGSIGTRVADARIDPVDVWEGRANQNDIPAAQRPCYARGCPMLGTITDSVVASHAARWLCRHHDGQDARQWGEITRRLRAGEPAPRTHDEVEVATTHDAIASAALAVPADPRHWAVRLRDREAADEDLTPIQRRAWRAALRSDCPVDDDDEARIERAAIQAEATAKETTR